MSKPFKEHLPLQKIVLSQQCRPVHLQQIDGETEEEKKFKRRAHKLLQTLKKNDKRRSKTKPMEAMAIADKKATIKGDCVFGEFVLQMRPDKRQNDKRNSCISSTANEEKLKISCAKWHHHAKGKNHSCDTGKSLENFLSLGSNMWQRQMRLHNERHS